MSDMKIMNTLRLLSTVATLTAAMNAFSADSPAPANYSPHVDNDFPSAVYFGDTHVHTDISMDAGAFGNNLGVAEAYRFARGETVESSKGLKAKLVKPLDFLVIADHTDNMGFFPDLLAGADHVVSDPTGKRWYDQLMGGEGAMVAMEIIQTFSIGEFPESLLYSPESKAYKDVWDDNLKEAEANNDPGKFTALIGYEWTSLKDGNNMHRVVIYRDNADIASKVMPYTTLAPLGSTNPRDLWKWMENYEENTGGQVLAIAHNGNLSNGIMFPITEIYDGTTVDEEYVNERIRREPLYEITQMKGDGESHPLLSPDDEFADYENWDISNLGSTELKTPDMLPGEYGREALKRGLEIESRLGTNPYKFGLIGSTDTHTSLATTREDNFFGKMSSMEPSPERLIDPLAAIEGGDTVYYRNATASGLAAVWAIDNTREALFDAMQRKETYATTGTRMRVRLFAGWDYAEDTLQRPDFVKVAYEQGVPMGGDLTAAAKGASPKILVQAMRDPDGANLDRVQIIKGWVDANGKTHEEIYDVACSKKRTIENNRCDKEVGNTVDIKTATYLNSIGSVILSAFWQDPEFNPEQRAFYYARVLEIPTPRWTTYDAVRFGVELPKDVPAVQQERAYTTPVWYTP